MSQARRRPLPSKITHLQAQAAMPGTLNGDSAARELAQLNQPDATPTAPAPAALPDATPTPPPPANRETASSPATDATPAVAAQAHAAVAEAELSSPTVRARKAPAKEEKRKETTDALNGSVARLSLTHTHEIKGAVHHFIVEHQQRLTVQGFVSEAIDHYLAHLRKTGKLPAQK